MNMPHPSDHSATSGHSGHQTGQAPTAPTHHAERRDTPANASHLDVVVIGAGPAGMQAAIAAAAHGLRVRLLDDQPEPGGQIYRAITRTDAMRSAILGPDYGDGAAMARTFAQCGADYWGDTAVWQITRERQVHVLRHGASHVLSADHIVLATGAMERPFPIPGWTLPGVMTAGAAQILLKSEGAVPAHPAVLAGCGPLLYLLAWQYLQAGIPIQAIVQTTPAGNLARALRHLPALAAGWADLKKGLSLIRALKQRKVPIHRHATDLHITGDACATGLQFTAGGKRILLESPLILLHQGVVPNNQATWALRARHDWNALQHAWVPATDDCGALDVPGFYLAGDGAGIVGASTAALQGRLAGLAIARDSAQARAGGQADGRTGDQADNLTEGRAIARTSNRPDGQTRSGNNPGAAALDADIRQLQQRIRKQRAFRRFLDALYEPAGDTRIPADDTIVCRCENVTAGDIRLQLRNGSTDPNQVKSFTRCGMGPCQGRQCGLTVTELIASHHGVPESSVGYYRLRPPLRPITLAELASEQDAAVGTAQPQATVSAAAKEVIPPAQAAQADHAAQTAQKAHAAPDCRVALAVHTQPGTAQPAGQPRHV